MDDLLPTLETIGGDFRLSVMPPVILVTFKSDHRLDIIMEKISGEPGIILMDITGPENMAHNLHPMLTMALGLNDTIPQKKGYEDMSVEELKTVLKSFEGSDKFEECTKIKIILDNKSKTTK